MCALEGFEKDLHLATTFTEYPSPTQGELKYTEVQFTVTE